MYGTTLGRRVAVSLNFLEDAVHGGYSPAYFELYKAHAFLAREFRARIGS
jgi:hypothetical protein